MDPETALELVKKGATLLLLDVPQFTLIGIDTQMFSVGPNFKGIKMIPPGPHFIYYSSSNRGGDAFSPITGFFIDANPSEVFVRKWDLQEEWLVKVSEEEEERYCQAVKALEFDRQLGPYTLNQFGEWKLLSNYITKSTIDRLEPIGGEITAIYEADIAENNPKTVMEEALDEQLKRSKISRSIDKLERKGCYYTSIPRVIKQKGICGQELTSLNLDKTSLLENILMENYGGDEDLLLAELQFAFIAFLMGQSLEAFLQWKALLGLLFGCIDAPLHARTHLFRKFVKVFYYQLKYGFQNDQRGNNDAAKGSLTLLDETYLTADNFLHHLCKTRKLKELLENTLGWVFHQDGAEDSIYDEEDDEFAPVVVRMNSD